MVHRMLSALCSMRRPSVSARTANFVALYTVPPGAKTLKPATEAMLMMWPCFCMMGNTAAGPSNYHNFVGDIWHSHSFFFSLLRIRLQSFKTRNNHIPDARTHDHPALKRGGSWRSIQDELRREIEKVRLPLLLLRLSRSRRIL